MKEVIAWTIIGRQIRNMKSEDQRKREDEPETRKQEKDWRAIIVQATSWTTTRPSVSLTVQAAKSIQSATTSSNYTEQKPNSIDDHIIRKNAKQTPGRTHQQESKHEGEQQDTNSC